MDSFCSLTLAGWWVQTTGYATASTDDAIQANVVAAGYGRADFEA